MFSTAQLLAMLVAVFLPILNGLATRYTASKLRAVLQLVLSAANGLLTEAAAGGASFDWKPALLGVGVSLATAIAVEMGVWAPLGVSDWAKRNGVGKRDYDLAA